MSHDIDDILRRYTALVRTHGADPTSSPDVTLSLEELRRVLITLRNLRDSLERPLEVLRGKSVHEVMEPGLMDEVEHAMQLLASKVPKG